MACFSTSFILFHVNLNLGSRQFLDCFSFGICKVRDTAARKLKRVQMIKRVVPRYSSRTAGSYFRNKPKKWSATQATQTAISHLHRSMIYLTFMMNIILFKTALTFSVPWLITLSFTDVHILRRQSVKSNFVYFRSVPYISNQDFIPSKMIHWMIFPSNVFNVLKNREGVFKTLENWKMLNLWVVINKKNWLFLASRLPCILSIPILSPILLKCRLQIREFIADPQTPPDWRPSSRVQVLVND